LNLSNGGHNYPMSNISKRNLQFKNGSLPFLKLRGHATANEINYHPRSIDKTSWIPERKVILMLFKEAHLPCNIVAPRDTSNLRESSASARFLIALTFRSYATSINCNTVWLSKRFKNRSFDKKIFCRMFYKKMRTAHFLSL
jgi:hypothetical protein